VIGTVAAFAISSVAGCREPEPEPEQPTMTLSPLSTIDFPPPTDSSVAVEVALRGRRSVREFAPEPLSESEIGQLLWAAQGITAEWGGRTAPSAGALYPLELHAVTSSRVLHYLPDGHRGEVTAERDLRPDLSAAALDQESVGHAPLIVAVVAVPARTDVKYGDRAGRYVDIETGHAAQNLLLQAVALGFVAVSVGSFDDEAVIAALALPRGHEPRYLLAVGRPLAANSSEPDDQDAGG
jgi:SagB-type dehydrogenase family enzyme